jgi:hypothetical protein
MGKTKETQKDRVIKYIKDFGSITPGEAFTELGAYRLSAIIYDLKHKDGYNIKTEIQSGKNRYGDTTHFAKYSFIEQDEELMKHIPSIM